ncbi:hypothetical protein [Intestinibacillus sp. Marseille-P6563]|uniref:hypothetical protein n=1 Tax=Intestinibacillus sp. Marseille-P6563 TaxID=2364792 RepID=UPI0013DF2B75|nr:hypothetical protein [Intestinibacillus sp. Marseille-P6563]
MKKLKFWLITLLILLAVPLGNIVFQRLFTNPQASYGANHEIGLSMLYSNLVTVGCTAVILYHLKFHK